MILMDLAPGELFIWLQQPNEIHKMVKPGEDISEKTIARCVAWKDNEGKWIFATRAEDQEWNSLAEVQQIEVVINPIE